MRFRKRTTVLLLIGIGILLYSNVVHGTFIQGDDQDQITNNVQVHSITNIPRFFFQSTYYNQQDSQAYGLFYRPVMMSAYAMLYSSFGPNPAIFHLFQLFFHIANTIIVFFIAISFFPELLSFLLACIFLVHPINSETVIHAANLQDVLFFFFGGLAFLSIIKKKTDGVTRKSLILFSVSLCLSVFSKETGFLFGLVTIAYLFLFNKRNVQKVISAFAIVTLIYCIFRFFLGRIGFGESPISPISHANLSTRLINIPAILLKYFSTFIFPQHLETAQLWIIKKVSFSGFFIPLMLIILISALCIFAGVTIRRKSKKIFSVFVLFTIWFLLGLSLHIQIIPLDVTVAERWFYFPMVGLLGMLATVYYGIFFKNILLRKIGFFICLAIIILFTIRTYLRIFDWSDSETLFTQELQLSPHNYLIENNLGDLYIQNGAYEKARPFIVDSVKQYPYLGNLNNMAILFVHEKNIHQANKYFILALQQGANYTVYKNYANFLEYIAKDNTDAYRIASTGIPLYPGGGELYLVKAQAEYFKGDYVDALKDAKIANTILSSPLTHEVYQAIQAKRDIHLGKFLKLD